MLGRGLGMLLLRLLEQLEMFLLFGWDRLGLIE
jgi:hypothetical protein